MKARSWKLIAGLLSFLGMLSVFADPLNQWSWRYPYPQGATLVAVTYGGGQFVAVGDNGTIVTSPDGYHWSLQSQGLFPYLRAVAYVAGKFAAVGDGGTIVVSSNAITWTKIPGVTSSALYGVAGDPTWSADGLPQFIAVGAGGAAVAGAGSGAWTSQTTGSANNLRSVMDIGGAYVVVGDAGTVLEYYQGWGTKKNAGTTNYLQTAIYAKGTYFYGGYYEVAPDGGAATILDTTSLARYSTATPDSYWDNAGVGSGNEAFAVTGLVFGNGLYVGVGYAKFMLEYDNPGILIQPPLLTRAPFWRPVLMAS